MAGLILGLIGGIGSGKSTAASFFRKRGFRIVDADALARRLLDRPRVRRALVRALGPEVVRRGRVDRAAVARKAFADAGGVRRLNAAVHPHVRRELQRRLRLLRRRGRDAVVDAPLLLETGNQGLCDILVFVDAPRRIRTRRVARRGWNEEELGRRERAQWPPSRKRRRADYVLRNRGSLPELRRQIDELARALRASRQEET